VTDVELRPLRPEDIEQAAYVETVAFYGRPTPERTELMRRYLPPEWTVGAFVDGRLVADVRTMPTARRINGVSISFGAVGPVACLAEHRRKGYVGRLLRMSLQRMREQGIPLSGLHTPHDDLYRRYGWERAEGNKRYDFRPKDLSIRLRGRPGTLEPVKVDDWQRLDKVYRQYAEARNGPLDRPESWWREMILYDHFRNRSRDALLWLGGRGEPQGFIVYVPVPSRPDPDGEPDDHDLFVRDMVSLTPDAYLGLWQHLLVHDIARRITVFVPSHDPFADLVVDPWKVEVGRSYGAMVRVVDVERALAQRPYCGRGAVSFTMRIVDHSASWNDGVWRVEASKGRMRAQRTDAEPDLELSVNFLAPLFTGFVRADQAASVGMLKVNREKALPQAQEAFAVTHPPYCNDWY
jgi:predicted acetyltransferase